MGKIELSLTDNEKEALDKIWKVVKERTREKTLKALGWNDQKAFLSDIFRHGMTKASEDPMKFIRGRILGEFPILKENVKEEKLKGDLEKIYG